MSKRWNPGVFLAKARELSRRLRSWHIEDFLNPVQFASHQESRRWVRLTFREIITNVTVDPSPKPVGWQFYMHDGGKPDDEGCVGEAFQNPDQDTDRSLTMWLMGDFLRHLDAAPPLPALDYLKESFNHLLELPAWTISEPSDVGKGSIASYGRDERGELRRYMVTGRSVPPEFLDALTDAAEKLLDTAPPDWGNIQERSEKRATMATSADVMRGLGEAIKKGVEGAARRGKAVRETVRRLTGVDLRTDTEAMDFLAAQYGWEFVRDYKGLPDAQIMDFLEAAARRLAAMQLEKMPVSKRVGRQIVGKKPVLEEVQNNPGDLCKSFRDYPDLFRAFGSASAMLSNISDLRDHAAKIAGAEHPLEEPRAVASLIGFVARWEDLEDFPRMEKALIRLYEELARGQVLHYDEISGSSATKLIVTLAWKAKEILSPSLLGVFPLLQKALPPGISLGSLDIVLVVSQALAERYAAFGADDPKTASGSAEFLAKFAQTRMAPEISSPLAQVLELEDEAAYCNALHMVYRTIRENADFYCAVLGADWTNLCRQLTELLKAFNKSNWTAELENDFIMAGKARPGSPPPPVAESAKPLTAQERSKLEGLERQIAGLAGGEADGPSKPLEGRMLEKELPDELANKEYGALVAEWNERSKALGNWRETKEKQGEFWKIVRRFDSQRFAIAAKFKIPASDLLYPAEIREWWEPIRGVLDQLTEKTAGGDPFTHAHQASYWYRKLEGYPDNHPVTLQAIKEYLIARHNKTRQQVGKMTLGEIAYVLRQDFETQQAPQEKPAASAVEQEAVRVPGDDPPPLRDQPEELHVATMGRQEESCFDSLVREVLYWRNSVLPFYWRGAYHPDDFQRRTADPLRRCLVWLDAKGFNHVAARLQTAFDVVQKCVSELDTRYEQHPAPADATESDSIVGDRLIPCYDKTIQFVDLVEDVKRATVNNESLIERASLTKSKTDGQEKRNEAEAMVSPTVPLLAVKPIDDASIALMRVFTNGLADDRIKNATRLLSNRHLTANDKLTKIDALIPFPATASAEQLGEMLGVTKQAVLKTDWWIQNRKGEKENEIGRRREGHRKKAKEYEKPEAQDDGNQQ
jgi:hypothetical protein